VIHALQVNPWAGYGNHNAAYYDENRAEVAVIKLITIFICIGIYATSTLVIILYRARA
jgi:hypothetical protein